MVAPHRRNVVCHILRWLHGHRHRSDAAPHHGRWLRLRWCKPSDPSPPPGAAQTISVRYGATAAVFSLTIFSRVDSYQQDLYAFMIIEEGN